MAVHPLVAGLRCRCPNCGEGPLFRGFLKVRERCVSCGADLTQADSGDGPVVFILLIVGGIGCFGLLFTEVALRLPVWIELAIWLPVMAVMTLGAIRPFKAVLIALQFHNRASEAGRGDERP